MHEDAFDPSCFYTPKAALLRIVVLTFVALMLGSTQFLTPHASAAAITVNSFADVEADDGQCTLREAIEAANTDSASGALPGECPAGSGPDVIHVPGGSIYFLPLGELVIFTDMEIIGEGRTTTVIDAGGTTNIFRQTGLPSNFTIRDLTLRNAVGSALQWGSSIGSGLATIDNVLFYNNSTTFFGGAIENEWEMDILNSSFNSNRATGGTNSNGGAIRTTGTTTIIGSDFINNQTDSTGPSGGNGGAIIGGSLTITDCSFFNNQANNGGALAISGTNRITNSTFAFNSANSTRGGAIFLSGGVAAITNATFSQNTNGGVYAQVGSQLDIQNSTFYDNSNEANISGAVNLKNSILFSFSSDPNCSGVITSAGYNLDNNGTCGLTGTGDQSGVDPMLGLLLDNGGPTQTHALPAGSPAIDSGNPAGCTNDLGVLITTDQRGLPRASDGNLDGSSVCDIGAYEFEPLSLFMPLILR